ncbi:hypothetical protein [Pseudobutyrivibrio sp.]|jgi:hypothetical protein|uniref:hypothetical protein n=1 Tax=Pseudobutyrivibrio sp. TaxID=2014367 RepID=UPI0025E68113|nr:hypothetical protein [Pseudobutyrivibrio sp.]
MNVVSKRKYFNDFLLAMMVVGVLLAVSTLIANYYVIHIEAVSLITEGAALLTATVLFLALVITIIANKGLIGYINKRILLSSIEKNLIAIGAYTQGNNKRYAILPRIKIKDNEIRISLNNLRVRQKIEQYINSFSTALPDRYIVEDYYISQNNAEMIISYMNVKDFKHEQYTIADYCKRVRELGTLELYFDKKHIININDEPHWLCSGNSGSGKSYFTQEVLMQAIIKGWDVVVIDIKRSYGLFKEYIDYVYEISDVIGKLQIIEKEMYSRLERLQPELDRNPRALAIDIGCKPMLVIVEEFISLQAALDKKDKEELERVVKNISVLARQANIHLMIVLQAAGTENINATTRSNLNKILFGNAQSNILNATFGTSVDLPAIAHFEKGEGLIQTDRITVLRAPTITDIDNFKDVI